MSSYGGHQSWGRDDGDKSWGRNDSWGRKDRGNRGWNDNSQGGWGRDGGSNRGWNRRQGGGRNKGRTPPAPPLPGSGQQSESGPASNLSVTGCVDPVVGPIIRGNYACVAENHDRPVYKKVEQAQGLEGQLLDVMIYFWDDPTDASFCGWWFGPKVGGDQVWAHQPVQSTGTPPSDGWKVPFDGDVDTSMVLATGFAKLPPKPPAPPPKPSEDDGPPPGVWQQPGSNGAGQEAGQKRESDAKEAEARKVPKVSKEEDEKRKQEQSAVLAIKRVVQRVKLAKPETFEALAGELAKVLEEKSSAAGSQASKVCEEAAKALEQAKQRVGLATKHLQKVGEQREEVEKDRKERREAVKGLLQQLETHVVNLEKETEALRKVGIDLQDVGEIDEEASSAAVQRISEQTDVCSKAYEACTDFNRTKMEKASGLILESRQELDTLMQRAETAARSREPLRQAAERSRMQAVERREAARQVAARKALAEDWVEQQRRLFQSYDKDCDGALNRREVTAFAKSEFGVEMSPEALDQLLLEPVPLPIIGSPDSMDVEMAPAAAEAPQVPTQAPEPRGPRPGMEMGIQFGDFQQLKLTIGVAREVARDGIRRIENQERRRVLAQAREGRRAVLQEVVEAIETANGAAREAEERTQELLDFGGSIESMESAPCARAARMAEAALEAARSSEQAVQQRAADATEAASPDEELRPEVEQLRARLKALTNRIKKAASRSGVFWRRMDELRRVEDEATHNRIMSLLRGQLESGDNRRQRSEILFAKIDAKADEKVDQDELVNFLQANWDDDAFPRDAVVRWFQQLDGDDTTSISADTVHRLVRTCYKVLEEVVMTDRMAVGDDEVVIKRLVVNDVVEMYDEPKEDGDTGTQRLRARALSGGEVGYVTVKNKEGTVFLDTGGSHYTVTKELSLSESSEMQGADADGGPEAASSQRACVLKVGEILEVLQYAKKDKASGSMRMKVKTLSKGAVGWVTSVDAQGTAFVKPI